MRALLIGPSRVSGRIAQLVEQLTLNQRVVGSIPTAPTIRLPRNAGNRMPSGGERQRSSRRAAGAQSSDKMAPSPPEAI